MNEPKHLDADSTREIFELIRLSNEYQERVGLAVRIASRLLDVPEDWRLRPDGVFVPPETPPTE